MNLGLQLAAAAFALVAAAAAAVVWRGKLSRRTPPRDWVTIGEVSRLCIYTLKSGKAVEARQLRCTVSGVALGDARDRMLLVVDRRSGRVKSGREYPRLTQVTATVDDGRLTLTAGDAKPLCLDLPRVGGVVVNLRIWDATAQGIDCGDAASNWLMRYLSPGDSSELRLVYRRGDVNGKDFNPGMKRFFRLTNTTPKKEDAGLFSDTFSYHLVSEASVDDLNRRMTRDRAISPLNFRPNIIVRGEELLPFEEDTWEWIKINDVVFRFLAPCMRCSFTTIDPGTGVRSEYREPITTLKRYRMVRDRKIREVVYTPTMGIYIGARSSGVISVGDSVSVPAFK